METECMLWASTKDRKGYGRIPSKGVGQVQAHRAMYEAFIGEIPEGMHVLHKCDTPPCVNPDHLFLGTHNDNMADMKAKGRATGPRYKWNAVKTHCPHDHEYTPENTYVGRDGTRSCRTCHRIRMNKRNAKLRAEAQWMQEA
jgi:hypothetical protein